MRKNLLIRKFIEEHCISIGNNHEDDSVYVISDDNIPDKYSLFIGTDSMQNILLYAYCQIVLDKTNESKTYLNN